jgi:uncharacterized protein YecT (DUF1311 family)
MSSIPFSAGLFFRITNAAAIAILLSLRMAALAEAPKVLLTSPKGTYRIEQLPSANGPASENEEVYATEFIVKVSDPAQRAPIPQTEPPTVSDFTFSPDEKWFAVNVYQGGWNAGFRLYQLKPDTKLEQVTDAKAAWDWLKQDKLDDLFADAILTQRGWSFDSSRLLLQTPIGGDRKPRVHYSFYFNLRSRRFETTEYLRSVNRHAMRILKSTNSDRPIYGAEAEPMDEPPSIESNRARYEAAEAKLNKIYDQLMKRLNPEVQSALRDEQRDWLLRRAPGAQAFAALRPKPKRPIFHQHYLAETTESRVRQLEAYLEGVSQ